MTKCILYVQLALAFLIIGLTGSADNNAISMTAWVVSVLLCGAAMYALQCVHNALVARHARRQAPRRVRRAPAPAYRDTRRVA